MGDGRWAPLNAQIESGKLELTPGVIQDLLTMVGKAISMVKAVQKDLPQVSEMKPFSTLGSSEALAARFAGHGIKLGDILKQQLGYLEDMMDTIVAAGKAYDNADEQSKIDLDAVRKGVSTNPADISNSKPAKPVVGTGVDGMNMLYPGASGDDPKTTLPKSLKGGDGTFEPRETKGENPHAISAADYQKVQNWIYDNSTFVKASEAGQKWLQLSGLLSTEFTNLNNKMVAIKNNWSGDGADAAAKATVAYGSEMVALTQRMTMVGEILNHTSRWIQATGYEMGQWDAPVPEEKESQKDYDDRVNEAKRKAAIHAMEMAYLPGLDTTDGAIATLLNPEKPTKDGIDPNLLTNQAGPGPGPGGGGNPYTPNGGPSLTPMSNVGRNMPGGPGPGGMNNNRPSYPPGSGTDPREIARRQQEMQAQADRQRQAEQQRYAEQARQVEQQRRAAEQQRQAAQRRQEEQQQQAEQRRQQAERSQQAQQAIQAAQQAAQQAMQEGQRAMSGLPGGTPGLPVDKNMAAKLNEALKMPGGKAGGAGGGIGGGAGGAGSPFARAAEATRLFPRAGIDAATGGLAAGTGRAGMPSTGMTPGSPGPAGAAGRGAGESDKGHKRPAYLESTEALEEAIGPAPVVFKPVVDQ
ncbi:hypothetical protein [Nocardia lijiangensis]|uniref:hypothetical protein n=1 Tax=Nocardia lijiangensis TaxID=299618 RepID=UPI003D71E499